MADEKQQKPARENREAPKAERKGEEAPASKYAVHEHLRHAKAMYGVPSHVVGGALALLEERGDKRDEYTKAEVEGAVSDFAKREIKES